MCTVGTYGLRGWKTSETPSASNGAPASSGRCCVADRSGQLEGEVEIALGEVVEEDAADAARLVAMLQVKVAVAPGLEARIVAGPERLERLPAARVEVARILLEAVVGREVHAAAEPPDVPRRKVTYVHVH